MNILFVGDISGRPGRDAIKKVLPDLQKKHDIDVTIANIENASSGKGVTEEHFRELKALGIDCFTSGNHIWAKREILPILEDPSEIVIRPLNFPPGTPGRGSWSAEFGTTKVAVINVMGRVFMDEGLDDPFRALDAAIAQYPDHLIIVDAHTEATSEKRALGFYCDGRVAAVLGTHTHVPTADAQILPKGTAYQSDIGFVGAHQSILGVETEIVLHNFTHFPHEAHEIATGDAELNAVVLQSKGNKVTDIIPIRQIVEL